MEPNTQFTTNKTRRLIDRLIEQKIQQSRKSKEKQQNMFYHR